MEQASNEINSARRWKQFLDSFNSDGECAKCGFKIDRSEEDGSDIFDMAAHLVMSEECSRAAGLEPDYVTGIYGDELRKAGKRREVPLVDSFHKLYSHLGETVRIRGRVMASTYRLLQAGAERTPHQILMLDALEGGGAALQVWYESYGEELPSGIVECVGKIPSGGESEGGDEDEVSKKRPKPPKLVEPVFYADKVTKQNSAWEQYRPGEDDLKRMALWKIEDYAELRARVDACLVPHISGRGFEKMAALLTAASPILPAEGMPRGYFCLKTIFGGKWREGKDEIISAAAALCPDAVQINGENCSQAGIVGGVERNPSMGGNLIRWGALVSADKTLCGLSGVSGLSAEMLGQLREVLATGKAKIDKIARGEKPARARMLMTANTNRNMDEYPSFYTAMRDIGANGQAPFKDGADFTRLHLVVPIAGTVPFQEKADSQFRGANPADFEEQQESLRLILRDAWARRREEWACDLPALREAGRRLGELAGAHRGVTLAVFEAEAVYILYALAGGFAALSQRRDEAGRLFVDKTAIRWALLFIEEMLQKLQVTETLKTERELDHMAHHAAELILLAMQQESEVEPSPDAPEVILIQNEAFRHKAGIKRLLKLLGHLSSSAETRPWEMIARELEEPLENLRKTTRIADAWLEKHIFEELGAQKPALFQGTPNNGVSLTGFGMRTLKFLVRLNSGTNFYDGEYQITRIKCARSVFEMGDLEHPHDCKIGRLLK